MTEVGDGSVTANFAVTLPFFNGYLWAVGWAIQSFLVCLTLDLVDYYKYQLK